NLGGSAMNNSTVEIWVRLCDGESVCERYNQREMAEFVRNNMLERIQNAMPLVCFDGDRIEIPANRVTRIDVVEPFRV
ncbi:MAG TPA: hypothetical protein VGN11_06790, partial [Candidatus Baltobacteraceae bacterium]|nr:hypothetical protein [Candidatus Baltobacteraceae bacterium]